MNVVVIGINFRTAPVELREKVAFTSSGTAALLRRMADRFRGTEFAVLSTCNRTELYAAGPDVAGKKQGFLGVLTGDGNLLEGVKPVSHFYVKENLEAVEHLMAVASSLDSMVIGETEILGQVKEAYKLAVEAQPSCGAIHMLFQKALTAAKRVHSETDICRGRVSISSIAVEFAEKVFDDLSVKSVMIVGAGETSELTLQSLIKKGVKEVLVLNRSIEKGKALAKQCGGRAIQFDCIDEYLPLADIVISSTGASHCVLHAASVRKAVEARHGRPILLIDIAVPRDVEARAGDLDNVYLYDIDDLQKIAAENMAKRHKAVEKAWAIVREEGSGMAAEFSVDGLGSLMGDLDRMAREIEDTNISRAFAREKMRSLSEDCREEIRELVHKSLNKVLAEPRKALREAAVNGQWEEYARVVRHVFGLSNGPHDENNDDRKM